MLAQRAKQRLCPLLSAGVIRHGLNQQRYGVAHYVFRLFCLYAGSLGYLLYGAFTHKLLGEYVDYAAHCISFLSVYKRYFQYIIIY